TAASLITGCSLGIPPPPTPPPTTAANGWDTLASGLERRMYAPGGDNAFAQLFALRIDPALYTFRAHYRPGDPLTLPSWRDTLPGVVALINANFFDTARNVLGLLVADGVTYGQSFVDRGGMVQVVGGYPRVRSLISEPYYGEALEQAVQGFPVLVLNGQQAYTTAQGDRVARRTVVGQDANGRIVILVTTSLLGMRLVDLSAYLPTTDLNLITAVNLDGGGSTMLYVSTPSPYLLYSFDPVPAVLAVYPR
ncbi:MAG: phosphodiester glycosidase family protein, partial [Anaerolinea sp.]|nr:phosphodiester glycosidase family protein [Anaerolinea sp.]